MYPVVLCAIDGVCSDALSLATCPTLAALPARGSYTLQASSVMPSITLPCFASIFYSVPPSLHGITKNEWVPKVQRMPGVVEVAREAGLRCAFFHNWEPLRDLNQPDSLHFSWFQDYRHEGLLADRAVAREAARYVASERPDFAFVYFCTVDLAGHQQGFMSDAYLAQLERVDSILGELLAALPPETNVLVASDHGGHDHTHGTDRPEDMTVPLFLVGPGIRRAHRIDAAVSILDIAPTLARLLGVAAPAQWKGNCIEQALLL